MAGQGLASRLGRKSLAWCWGGARESEGREREGAEGVTSRANTREKSAKPRAAGERGERRPAVGGDRGSGSPCRTVGTNSWDSALWRV